MDKISVLIADDHTLFRKGVRGMVETEEDMMVVGEAATGREALEQARALMPDVILMDIRMPDPLASDVPPTVRRGVDVGPEWPGPHSEQAMDGIEAARILCREMPHIGIIFVTMSQEEELVFRGLQAGGRGYILKDADPETMLRAIRAVANGESLLGPTIAEKVMRQFTAPTSKQAPFVDELTPRELEVLTLIAEGLCNKDIGGALSISEKTVKNHINNIFSKLHLYDRSQAILYAIRRGLVQVT